jgi:hypothetical protein
LLPVFIDEDEDHELALSQSRFEPIWAVLKALRQHDEILADELDQLRYTLGRRGGISEEWPGKIIIDLPELVGEEFVDALRTRVVETSTASWEFWLGLLQAYVDGNGDALVPRGHTTPERHKLAIWVTTQRTHPERLIPERIDRLDDLGFIWDSDEHRWELMYSLLRAYVDENGDALVPWGHTTPEGHNLGSWVSAQRTNKEQLTPEQIKRLDDLDFIWEPYEHEWESMYSLLQAYVDENGDALVPTKHTTPEGHNLGMWVNTQRTQKKRFTLERIERLDDLGFIWDVLEHQWELMYRLLQAYVDENGDALVPAEHTTPEGHKLGTWVSNQRTRLERLTPEQIKRLDDLGFIWDVDEHRWELMYSLLKAYLEENGDALVPRGHTTPEGHKLGKQLAQTQGEAHLRTDKTARRPEIYLGCEKKRAGGSQRDRIAGGAYRRTVRSRSLKPTNS